MILQLSTIFTILFLFSSPSYLIMSVEIDGLPSEYATPSTNTTWMINQLPSFLWFHENAPITLMYTPIILLSNSSSSGSQFINGFYCDYYITSCFFGIIIFQNTTIMDLNHSFMDTFPVLVWSANRNYPLQGNATLKFTSTGDLLLANGDGNLVWSTKTAGKSVLGLKLTEIGNLVLFGNDNSIIWQSFDYPTDTLVRGQILFPGQKLTASQGLYSLTRENHDLFYPPFIVAYIGSDPPQAYFNSSTGIRSNEIYSWFRNIQEQNASTNFTYQFTKLEANGHFNIYWFSPNGIGILIDLFEDAINDCSDPMACGRYGLCSESNQCSCPDEMKDGKLILKPLENKKPDLGCTLPTNISCDDSQHILVELKNTTYFNFFQQQGSLNLSLNNCKSACLRNCSCKALVYSFKSPANYYSYYDLEVHPCLLINEVFSLKDVETKSLDFNHSVFLKVQEMTNEKIRSQDSSPKKRSRVAKTVVASIVGTITSICLLFVFYFLIYNRRKMVKPKIELQLPQLSGLPTRFSYEHLKSITCNFSRKLGEGGFGSVFEGTLSNDIKVAVKFLDGFDQLKKSFLAEVETIGNIHHVNLVKLIGYCVEESYTLLVYEYMPNGSLDKWIFYNNREVALGWELRKNIIIDVAKGLSYLHEDCRQKILHLDIKPQNILLDENFNAKISDFGLAKLVEKDHSQIITTLRGTPGYIAPEWLSLNITEKVDVYSFGVVIMEILCGRPNLDRYQTEENKHLLAMFKREGEEGRLQDLIDKDDLEMQSNMEEVVKIIKLAAWCLQSDFSRRPSMTSVVKVLECLIEVENNLDYNFTNPPITKVARDPNVMLGVTAPLLPSILSGPR